MSTRAWSFGKTDWQSRQDANRHALHARNLNDASGLSQAGSIAPVPDANSFSPLASLTCSHGVHDDCRPAVIANPSSQTARRALTCSNVKPNFTLASRPLWPMTKNKNWEAK
jgi:hypothetical protein